MSACVVYKRERSVSLVGGNKEAYTHTKAMCSLPDLSELRIRTTTHDSTTLSFPLWQDDLARFLSSQLSTFRDVVSFLTVAKRPALRKQYRMLHTMLHDIYTALKKINVEIYVAGGGPGELEPTGLYKVFALMDAMNTNAAVTVVSMLEKLQLLIKEVGRGDVAFAIELVNYSQWEQSHRDALQKLLDSGVISSFSMVSGKEAATSIARANHVDSISMRMYVFSREEFGEFAAALTGRPDCHQLRSLTLDGCSIHSGDSDVNSEGVEGALALARSCVGLKHLRLLPLTSEDAPVPPVPNVMGTHADVVRLLEGSKLSEMSIGGVEGLMESSPSELTLQGTKNSSLVKLELFSPHGMVPEDFSRVVQTFVCKQATSLRVLHLGMEESHLTDEFLPHALTHLSHLSLFLTSAFIDTNKWRVALDAWKQKRRKVTVILKCKHSRAFNPLRHLFMEFASSTIKGIKINSSHGMLLAQLGTEASEA